LWPVCFFIGEKVTLSLIQLVIADAVLVFVVKFCFQLELYAGLLVLPQLMWTSYWILVMYSIWLVNYNTQQTVHEKLLSSNHPATKKYGVYV
jgi:tryptophan-rich sensory protein